ncbi:hypothetical protein J6590_032168 [Homalodisca vitripennis]|nr:hypothetical protein J6590_032168 [Homalodisca vitripennis]
MLILFNDDGKACWLFSIDEVAELAALHHRHRPRPPPVIHQMFEHSWVLTNLPALLTVGQTS